MSLPTGRQPLAERVPEALKREVSRRFVYLIVGGAVLLALVVVGALLQRSRAIAGKAADPTAERDTLARKRLLEDGNRALAQGRPAEARTAFLELLRQAPESVAARSALEKADAALAKKDDQERRVAEAGARLAVAREARAAKDFARVIVEADTVLALVPDSAEAQELKAAAQAEVGKQGRQAQKKAAAQVRALKVRVEARGRADGCAGAACGGAESRDSTASEADAGSRPAAHRRDRARPRRAT